MAKLVLGIGVSHSPMLNSELKDWPLFIKDDLARVHRDKDGNPVIYVDLLCAADPGMNE